MAVLTNICPMVIHFYTAYLKKDESQAVLQIDSHTVLYSLWAIVHDTLEQGNLSQFQGRKGELWKCLYVSKTQDVRLI
jgi:hypothetical protein